MKRGVGLKVDVVGTEGEAECNIEVVIGLKVEGR